jgi:hypothetical protein
VSSADRRGEARAELRAQIAAAARIVSPVWPLGTFVAVNPLGGLIDRPFEEAVALARPVLGIRGLPPLAELRRALDEGRVTPTTCAPRSGAGIPAWPRGDVDALASRTVAAEEPDVAAPPRTVAERCDAALGTHVAAAVDAEVAKWCAAFADEDAGGWRMPGRERGLYLAWKDLAGRGPALRRLARPGVRDRLAAFRTRPRTRSCTRSTGCGSPPPGAWTSCAATSAGSPAGRAWPPGTRTRPSTAWTSPSCSPSG